MITLHALIDAITDDMCASAGSQPVEQGLPQWQNVSMLLLLLSFILDLDSSGASLELGPGAAVFERDAYGDDCAPVAAALLRLQLHVTAALVREAQLVSTDAAPTSGPGFQVGDGGNLSPPVKVTGHTRLSAMARLIAMSLACDTAPALSAPPGDVARPASASSSSSSSAALSSGMNSGAAANVHAGCSIHELWLEPFSSGDVGSAMRGAALCRLAQWWCSAGAATAWESRHLQASDSSAARLLRAPTGPAELTSAAAFSLRTVFCAVPSARAEVIKLLVAGMAGDGASGMGAAVLDGEGVDACLQVFRDLSARVPLWIAEHANELQALLLDSATLLSPSVAVQVVQAVVPVAAASVTFQDFFVAFLRKLISRGDSFFRGGFSVGQRRATGGV